MAGFSGDDRGVSEVLGAILVFGLVIALIALIQLHAVPAANANVEANHYDQVQEDPGRLQGAFSRAATGGPSEAVQLSLGTRYPSRFILINPPPVSGTLRTDDARSLTLNNVSAVDGETADYLATDGGPLSFDTHSIVYTPEYNHIDDPGSTVFETGVRYKQFRDGENVQEPGVLVDGRTITLVTVDGELSETAVSSTTISPVPLSSGADPVSIRQDGGPMHVRIPSNLSERSWQEQVLSEEYDPDQNNATQYVRDIACANGSVPAADPCDDHMVITFDETVGGNPVMYDLSMAKVGVGSDYTDSAATYITNVQGHNETVTENTTQRLVAEVRDQLNNPVSGVSVDAEDPSTGDVTPASAFTDSDGQATFIYEAENVEGIERVEINATIGDGVQAKNVTTFSVTVTDSGFSGSIDTISQQVCEALGLDILPTVSCDVDV